MPLHTGWDVIQTMCNEYKSLDCPVCNEKMQVERGFKGPTSWGEAMSGKEHKHDRYTCKNSSEIWHIQVRKLRILMRDTPSKKIADLLLSEIMEILVAKEPSKDNICTWD